MTITLTPDLEQALSEQAKQRGTTPERLAVDVLQREVAMPPAPHNAPGKAPGTLADFLEGYIGVVDSSELIPGGARMSEDSGKKFAEGLWEEHRGGRS